MQGDVSLRGDDIPHSRTAARDLDGLIRDTGGAEGERAFLLGIARHRPRSRKWSREV